MTNILKITDWNNYIYNEKIKLIMTMDKSNILDTSIDSLKFNDILKDMIRMNIFNVSYIAFMTFKFLETSFIPSEIILNVLNLCSNDDMYYLLLQNRKLIIIHDIIFTKQLDEIISSSPLNLIKKNSVLQFDSIKNNFFIIIPFDKIDKKQVHQYKKCGYKLNF